MTNAPTTRETADHAELARLAEAAKRVRRDSIGRLDGIDAHRKWDAFGAAANPATVLSLLSEIAALRGDLAEAEKDADDWAENLAELRAESQRHLLRATQAERQRDEALDAAALRDLTEWRDIATAPKDGTWMLACWAGSDRPAFGVVKWDSCDWIEGGDVVGIPTHWLPLPSAPNQAKEAGE